MMPMNSHPSPGHALGGLQGGACAACKHQRKKCSDNCELARFFPAEKQEEFDRAHKVFGVSNITKMLKGLATRREKERAAWTLTWEANWRAKDPVEGCYKEIIKREREIQLLCKQIEQCGECSRRLLHQQGNNLNNNLNKMIAGSIVQRVNNNSGCGSNSNDSQQNHYSSSSNNNNDNYGGGNNGYQVHMGGAIVGEPQILPQGLMPDMLLLPHQQLHAYFSEPASELRLPERKLT